MHTDCPEEGTSFKPAFICHQSDHQPPWLMGSVRQTTRFRLLSKTALHCRVRDAGRRPCGTLSL